MTSRTRFRRLTGVVALGVLVAAAAYMLVYLYRWEWHRALIAGTFLLVVELGIGIALVLDRVGRLEAKLDAQRRDDNGAAAAASSSSAAAAAATATTTAAATAAAAETRSALRAAEPPARQSFAWLSDSTDRMSVFVPLLLGAGVLLSALAWVVERIARVTARPTLERGLAARLQPLTVGGGALSNGGGDRGPLFVPGGGGGTGGGGGGRRGLVRVAFVAVALAATALLVVGIDSLGDASQNRPDTLVKGSAGRVVLRITNKAAPDADVASARNLWGACSNQIGTVYRLTGAEQLDGGRVELRVRPAVGKYAERRLRGCMNDSVIGLVHASVLEVSAR